MIGSIKGTIALKTEKFLLVETAGVGYKVTVSPDVLSKTEKVGGDVALYIHTHVREDSLDLYGFLDYPELEFFELLLGVSGIGPRSAIAILGIAPTETLRRAISTGDTAYLTKISGIGKKTAERIVLDLRDKMGKEMGGESLKVELDVMEALKSLGYSQGEVREALKGITPGGDTNTQIREALKALGGK